MSRAALVVGGLLLAGAATFVGVRLTGHTICTYQSLARTQVESLGGKVEAFAQDTGRYPATLDELGLATGIPGGQGLYAGARELIDPWKRPYQYRVTDSGFQLFSLGGDGRTGGEGNDADLAYAPAPRA